MENVTENIIGFIKDKSRSNGLSVNKLLLLSKLSPHLIDDWQTGRSEPSFPALQTIGKTLKVELKDFFADTNDLTEEQTEILSMWRDLNEQQKRAIFLYIEAMKSRTKSASN